MSEQERETEEDEGVASDTAPMLPRRRPTDYHISVLAPILATRGLGTLVLSGRALVGFLLHLLLPGTVFLLVLLPAAAVVYLGFLCHSRLIERNDASWVTVQMEPYQLSTGSSGSGSTVPSAALGPRLRGAHCVRIALPAAARGARRRRALPPGPATTPCAA